MATIKLRRTNGGVGLEYDDIDNNFENLNNDILSLAPNKNLIIGGDFTTNPWQRNTTFNVGPSAGYYTADRFGFSAGGSGAATVSRVANAPSFAQSGVNSQHSMQVQVTAADTSLTTSDLYAVYQAIEGYNLLPLAFGTAGARFFTVSFWVYSSVAGTYCVAFQNSGPSRSYVAQYTINTANMWEYKTITVPVDITGTWLTNNSAGLWVHFCLGSGPTYQTTANTWTNGGFYATSNQVNFMATVGNTFRVDLIQVEVGSTATPFEVLPYAEVLRRCHRYCYVHDDAIGTYADGTTSSAETQFMLATLKLPVTMRTTPFVTNQADFFRSRCDLFDIFGNRETMIIRYSISMGSTGLRATGNLSSGKLIFSAEF